MSDTNAQPPFCTSCGSPLTGQARFCANCGASQSADATPASAAASPQPQVAAAAPAGRGVALLVFGFLCVAGAAAAIWTFSNEETPAPRAVSGSPSQHPANEPAQQRPQMPPRENMEMPEEVKGLLDELTAKAEAAPESVEDWQNLTRALYRASVLNDTYQEGALEALEKLLKLDSVNLEGLRIAGNLSYDRGEFEEAEKHFHAFLKISPKDVGVITDLGSSQLFRGAVDEAVTTYREAAELDPTFLQAWFNLGIALQRIGDVPGAQEALTKAEELAEAPEQKAFIRDAIAAAGGAPAGLPPNHPPTGSAPAAPAAAKSNASTDFQRQAQQLLLDHSIVGPKIVEIDWEGSAQARVLLKQFPMDKMPAVMLNRFKSRINEALAKLAEEQGITEPTRLDLVDADSDTVMDQFDGKEWIGAFDEAQYE